LTGLSAHRAADLRGFIPGAPASARAWRPP